MKYGIIQCECGQDLYFETVRNKVYCIQCNLVSDVSNYPDKNEEIENEEIDDLIAE